MDISHPDKDDIIIINGRRMRILPTGEITALDSMNIVEPSNLAVKELSELDYLINNHPDRLDDVDAARARLAQLRKEVGDSSDAKCVTDKIAQLRAARLKAKMRANMLDTTNAKQND